MLREGTIVQGGTPDQLYTRPADVELARFLGAVNLIDADFETGIARTPLGALALRAGTDEPEHGAGLQARRGIVMVRPEQLEVRPRGESLDEGVAGSREVEQCRYYGHDALLHIRLDAPGVEQVLLARVQGEQALPAGTPVVLAAHGAVTAVE